MVVEATAAAATVAAGWVAEDWVEVGLAVAGWAAAAREVVDLAEAGWAAGWVDWGGLEALAVAGSEVSTGTAHWTTQSPTSSRRWRRRRF